MKRWGFVGLWATFGMLSVGAVALTPSASAAGPKKSTKADAGAPVVVDPPVTKDPVRLWPEALKFGLGFEDVAKIYDHVLDAEYQPKLRRVQPGVKMKALEAALEEEKLAFRRTRIDFGALPTGVDRTPLFGEYHYKNDEAMMSFRRPGADRYFFFQGGKLWKVLDEIELKEDGEYGATTAKALATLADRFGAPGREVEPSPTTGHMFGEHDWVDNVTHVRVVDRGRTDQLVLVYEDRTAGARLASLPPPQTAAELVNVVDPGIAAILRGDGGTVDPNASAADGFIGHTVGGSTSPAPSATPPKSNPKKK